MLYELLLHSTLYPILLVYVHMYICIRSDVHVRAYVCFRSPAFMGIYKQKCAAWFSALPYDNLCVCQCVFLRVCKSVCVMLRIIRAAVVMKYLIFIFTPVKN